MTTPVDATSLMTTAAAGLTDTIVGVAPVALGVGILAYGIRYGWKLVKRFSN